MPTLLQRSFSTLFLFAVPIVGISFVATANVPYIRPEPPKDNPHPPTTPADGNRVKFALEAVEFLLKKPLSPTLKISGIEKTPLTQDKDLACLQNLACLQQDLLFTNELIQLHREKGEVIETRHAHIIPWSFEKFNSRNTNTQPTQDREPAKAAQMGSPSMSAPNLRPDEYMVHIYVHFSKTSDWYHLDVIVTEKDGHLFLRHFFATPMVVEGPHFPPGVVC